MLFTYGSYNLIGIGRTNDYKQIVICYFEMNNKRLILKKTLTLLNINTTSYPYSFTLSGWYSAKFIQIDWKNKIITLPIYTDEK